jgi:hypothetical protein
MKERNVANLRAEFLIWVMQNKKHQCQFLHEDVVY